MTTLSPSSAPPDTLAQHRFADRDGDTPLRCDLFGPELLESHAHQLAAAGDTTRFGGGVHLLERLERNARSLYLAQEMIARAYRRREPIGPDAEWLFDNFHIVADALREVRTDLPSGYYKKLPKLSAGPHAGWPRAYELAVELVAHTDSNFDEPTLVRFVKAYQAVTPLTIGEVWAVPIMMRLVLLENLGRLARSMERTRQRRELAETWARELLIEAGKRLHQGDADRPLALDPPGGREEFCEPLAALLLQEFRNQGPELGAHVRWLEDRLRDRGVDANELLRQESQRVAANQVTVGNCVTSLRLLSVIDWTAFFEQVSEVEALLRTDPAGVYGRQDFATRDRYRQAVEQLARGSGRDERDLARLVLAKSAAAGADAGVRGHVGYYLAGSGRRPLERELGYRPEFRHRMLNVLNDHPEAVYFGGLAALAALFLAGVLAYASRSADWPWLLLVAVAVLLPVSELAVGTLNYLLTLVVPPRVLPKMEFKGGLPTEEAAFVVVPTLLARPASAKGLCEKLEIHYLSNPDPALRFALLTDFIDADSEHKPDDDAIVQAALDGVRALNRRYAAGGPDRFFVFHRKRVWDARQNCWMGWERKRGKLVEFNRILLGNRATSFTVQSGEPPAAGAVRYVITLDADTQLPRESAARLIATLAHPLNRPRFDPAQGRVVEGYGILQPRVGLSVSATRSLFGRWFAGSAGIDPYAVAVSDVYQDLFGRGSFTGKGIYDVRAFEQATGATFPDDSILSHDLIEGNFTRCALVTDIELLDDFPSYYHAYARREHRWARGDWQILPWLLPRVPAPERPPAPGVEVPVVRRPNPLPALERWKILDNLRRSLVAPGLVLLLALGWTVLPGGPWFWTALALAVLELPLLLVLLGLPLHLINTRSLRKMGIAVKATVQNTAGQAVLSAVFLANQAVIHGDAAARTLARLFVTRRHLLDWETSAAAERRLGVSFAAFWQSMRLATVLAAVLTALVAVWGQAGALWAALPLTLPWLVSPWVAYAVSRPRTVTVTPLTDEEEREVRRLARKTWAFFEAFVTAEEHWLPPDNFQDDPAPKVAGRTSPTNDGMYLASCLAAHDFGFVSLPVMLDRVDRTLTTLEKMTKHHGHLLNWYDTRTLKPLEPRYLSTVDSGNLLGSLIVLKQGLIEKAELAWPPAGLREGLRAVLELLESELQLLTDKPPTPECHDPLCCLAADVKGLWSAVLAAFPAGADGWAGWLDALGTAAAPVEGHLDDLASSISGQPAELRRWADGLTSLVAQRRSEHAQASRPADREGLRERARQLAARAQALGDAMDFDLLYDSKRQLFAVGYNLTQGKLDGAHYDLLASEVSLTSYLAVARGDVPKKHWFQLGRPMTSVPGGRALVSWGGTMFEYLMPPLFLREFPETLLDVGRRGAVRAQIEYGRESGVPWGVSEAAYALRDTELNYQYQGFGVPGLGLKRGLSRDLVVAPYATALAFPREPRAALANFRRLRKEGAEGAFGFYESIDYTKERLPRKARYEVIHTWMAHHQGMSLLALCNGLLGAPMVRRFHAEPMIRATELLLQERVAEGIPLLEKTDEGSVAVVREGPHPMARRITTPDTPHPRTHLLSNGNYAVMVTNAGGGRSTWYDLDVTRWREDRTRDAHGQFVYVRDLTSGHVWSAGSQPVNRPADDYEVIFAADKAVFRRLDGPIETVLEVAVAPEHDAEVRQVTLTNHDGRPHEVELTSYLEVVLQQHAAELAHPAFGKLFLETEYLPASQALLCRRRPRDPGQAEVWAVHVVAVEAEAGGEAQWETDRAKFLGRLRTPENPAALVRGAELSGTTGPVLDPVFSLRRRVRLNPEASVRVAFTTGVAATREAAAARADQFHDFRSVTRVFELAWAHSQVELRNLHVSAEDAHLFQRLAAYLVYAAPTLRAPAGTLAANRQQLSGLWKLGVSGDRPILLVCVDRREDVAVVRQLLLAHTFWRARGLAVDLVLLDEEADGYHAELYEELLNLARASDSHGLIDQPGGVFVRKRVAIRPEDQGLLEAAARVLLNAEDGTLSAQLERTERPERPGPPGVVEPRHGRPARGDEPADAGLPPGLLFANGYGGFTPDGSEYVVHLAPARQADPTPSRNGHPYPEPPSATPAPWANVIANPGFGCLVTEAGGGFTWSGNSQANRLTPWSNDPVSDPPGEVVYLRDGATGEVWSPTPLPAGAGAAVRVRHGQGYTVFERTSHELSQELTVFVAADDPVKLWRLRLRNRSRRTRKLSATFYAEWVLGGQRDDAPLGVVTAADGAADPLVARNPLPLDAAGRVAFADISLRPRTWTGDRTEFLGRNGSPARPAALESDGLSGKVGAGLDPCAAVQAAFTLDPGEERELVFVLGEAADAAEARRLAQRYRQPGAAAAALATVRDRWDRLLSAVTVATPKPEFDLLVNRWLPYQVLSCRVWGRSAFYQSSGAYGFRDQLQDVVALVHAAPEEARAQLLRAAGRQFLEGDVQHWWHPPAGRGVRTRCSDDLLWLPVTAAHYTATTGDAALWEERAPFLRGPALPPDRTDDYGRPEVAKDDGTVYEHCLRAIDLALTRFGPHGLPLIGSGDWNDGMNHVGPAGRGESVWLGWFLQTVLPQFADLAESLSDGDRAGRYRAEAERLWQALEATAWDGAWYRRAYFDDGTPLGSAQNPACRIDSLPQTWAVICGRADPDRAARAMRAVEEQLVDEKAGLIRLFTPPFDGGPMEPGYIKGYLPGVRENGGQYTHGAAWVVLATALSGRGTRAVELFNLLNPIRHALTPEAAECYKVEPYVMAGDVYADGPHLGRGGWTWYTGAAGWTYRVALETILGLHRRGDRLRIEPTIPADWPRFTITYRFGKSTYRIEVENPNKVEHGVKRVTVDGEAVESGDIELRDDGRTHEVRVEM